MQQINTATKVMIIVVVSLMVLSTLLIGFFIWRNRPPVVHIPAQQYPNPNAFDLYLPAGEKIVRKDDISDIWQHSVSHPVPLAEREKLLRENAPAMKAFQKGLSLPYCQKYERTLAERFPYIATDVAFAHLKGIESGCLRERGNTAGAMNAALDAVEFGNQIQNGGTTLAAIAGIACQQTGRKVAWDVIDQLDTATLKRATKRMQRIYQKEIPFWHCLLEDKYTLLNTFVLVMENPENTARVFDAETPPQFLRVYSIFTGKQQVIDNINHVVDQVIAESKGVYKKYSAKDPTESVDVLTKELYTPLHDAAFTARVNHCENILFLTALALRTFRKEHGHYPTTLQELVPQYIAIVPPDPFAENGRIGYRLDEGKPIVYSVGPDRNDDNGHPIDHASQSGVGPHTVHVESIGDIVGGINFR